MKIREWAAGGVAESTSVGDPPIEGTGIITPTNHARIGTLFNALVVFDPRTRLISFIKIELYSCLARLTSRIPQLDRI